MNSIHIVFKELPPSSNHIYFRGTILTKQAKEYAERFSQYVAQNHLHEVFQMDDLAAYRLDLCFYFPTLENESWQNPEVSKKKQAKSRYKRLDLTNRIKLLEDCVRDALSIDDCQTFVAHQEKHQDPINPRVEITVQKVDPEQFGLRRRSVEYGVPPGISSGENQL